jgi:hypothetical protein
MDYLIQETKKAGVGTCYWMGLSDGTYRTLPVFHQPDLAQTLIKAYYGSIEGYKYPTVNDFDIVYTINYADEWSEAFLYGASTPLKLSDYKGLRLELDKDSYNETLQVKLYGKTNSGKEAYIPVTGTVTTVNFADSQDNIGDEISRITLQKTIKDPQTAKVLKATLIKADDSESNCDISVFWGCTVTSEATPKPTGIRAIPMNKVASDGAIYNLRGQRILKPQKGFYIQDGKTHIAK